MTPRMPFIIRLAKATYAKMVLGKNSLIIKNKELIDKIKGPCLIVSNHTHKIDYILISAALPFHIRWVAGAYLFKMPFVSFVVKHFATCIAKEQGKSDLSTIINIKKALKKGDVVGIFPEGTRTWDGDTILDKSTTLTKMIRYLKVPVLFIQMQGSYCKLPRWKQGKEAKGPIFMNLVSFLEPENYLDKPLLELQEEINNYLFFSSDSWQEENHQAYEAEDLAEGLQRVLYMCPKCKAIDSHKTQGKTLTCSCGATTTIDEYYKLHSKDHNFTLISQWHRWEKEELKKDQEILFKEEKGVLLQEGDLKKMKTISKNFLVSANKNSIKIHTKDTDKDFVFELNEINDIAINAKQTVEFYYQNRLFRFRLEPQSCSLKYKELLNE